MHEQLCANSGVFYSNYECMSGAESKSFPGTTAAALHGVDTQLVATQPTWNDYKAAYATTTGAPKKRQLAAVELANSCDFTVETKSQAVATSVQSTNEVMKAASGNASLKKFTDALKATITK